MADDHQAAQSIGIPLNHIWVIVWAVAGVVAMVAGMIWGSKLGVQFSLSLIALKALPVVILGGLTSVPGAIIGGLIIGVGEKIAEVFSHLGWSAPSIWPGASKTGLRMCWRCCSFGQTRGLVRRTSHRPGVGQTMFYRETANSNPPTGKTSNFPDSATARSWPRSGFCFWRHAVHCERLRVQGHPHSVADSCAGPWA